MEFHIPGYIQFNISSDNIELNISKRNICLIMKFDIPDNIQLIILNCNIPEKVLTWFLKIKEKVFGSNNCNIFEKKIWNVMFQKKCLCNFWKLWGGVSQKSTWLEGRGWAKVHVGPQGGRGGQKRPKNGPHGLCMTPYMKILAGMKWKYDFVIHFLFTKIT